MADVTFTIEADLAGGVTAAELRDGLCEHWCYDSAEHGTKPEFIELMLLRYVKQVWKAYRGSVAGATAQNEAENEVVEAP